MRRALSGLMTSAIKPAAKIYLPFLTDVRMLRARARHHMAAGKVFVGLGGDPTAEIGVLNACLANEIVCALRFERHARMAIGAELAAKFLQHASEEQDHADRFAARIVEFGGAPEFSPEGLLTRADSNCAEGDDLAELCTEDLLAERVAVDSYREIAAYFSRFDSITQQMIEEIRAVEEGHVEDLAERIRECTLGE